MDVEDFRRNLIDAFPSIPFYGLVSTHDECDDGVHLRRELSGKRWDELSPEVLFHGSIGLPLLEPSALIAFLPAWLLRSMETSDVGDPIVLEFTLYFLCPGHEDDGWDEVRIAETVDFFNSGQRDAVADFLRFVANLAEGRDWKQRAEFGLVATKVDVYMLVARDCNAPKGFQFRFRLALVRLSGRASRGAFVALWELDNPEDYFGHQFLLREVLSVQRGDKRDVPLACISYAIWP